MATLSLYQDCRSLTREGLSPVKITLFHNRRTVYLPTGVRCTPRAWDPEGLRVASRTHKGALLNSELIRSLNAAREALDELEASGADISVMTAQQVKDAITWRLKARQEAADLEEAELQGPRPRPGIPGPRKKAESPEARDKRGEEAPTKSEDTEAGAPDLLTDAFEAYIRRRSGRTAQMYADTLRRVRAFLASAPGRTGRMGCVTRSWLEEFDAFLARTAPSANTRGIHLRNIRAVFNSAIDDGLTAAYPFRRFRIRTAPTRKRALTPGQLRLVLHAPVPPQLQRWRDLFALTFYLLGINFADLCALERVQGGRVEYVRRKTHKAYSVAVLPEAMEIIGRYRGQKRLLDYTDRCADYRTYYQGVVKGLHRLSEWLNEQHPGACLPPLSTYWARHTWATTAASLDIPKETIARALGHGDRSVTDIYIDFDMGKVDRAARMVADAVRQGHGTPQGF